MANILEIKNLNFKYGNTTIFKNFNLQVEEGTFTAIVGNNTSGKTTLMKLIVGILPSKDSISIGYCYINNNRIYDNCREFGLVLGSNYDSFLFEDVYKEMAFPLENLNIKKEEIEKKIIELANYFKITKLLDKKIIDLTKSEKQELIIVISLLHDPKVLLLDSPFSMMDVKTKEKMKKNLLKYKEKHNLTIILTTSKLEDVLDCDYLYVINKGNTVIEGTPKVVLKEDSILNRLGLSIPFMADLSNKLIFYELLNSLEFDMNRMVDNLWK